MREPLSGLGMPVREGAAPKQTSAGAAETARKRRFDPGSDC